MVSDEVSGSDALESQLGLRRGALEGPAAGWLDVLHPLDRDRYSLALDGLLHQRSGRINHELRLRGADGHYFWYMLKARPVVSADGEVVRVVGSLADVTELKSAEERMLHDAIHDNLTGLPNRELFYDRLDTAVYHAQKPEAARPVVLVVDIDDFKRVNDSYGLSMGDSTLLAIARRLSRDLKPGDTLARLGATNSGSSSPTLGPTTSPRGSTPCGRRSPPRSVSASGRSPSPSRSAPRSTSRSSTPREAI